MTNKKNSVLILNKRYGQPLTHFQEAEANAHREIGGIINVRENVRDTTKPYFEYVALNAGLFGKTEEEAPTRGKLVVDESGRILGFSVGIA